MSRRHVEPDREGSFGILDRLAGGHDDLSRLGDLVEPCIERTASRREITYELERRFDGKRLILGVDRIDYVKGIPHKLLAFEKFLHNNPQEAGKLILVQIAPPPKKDTVRYQKLRNKVHKLVGPVLMKQDLVEARGNVEKRLDYIRAENERLEKAAEAMQKKQTEKQEGIIALQQQMMKLANPSGGESA